MPMTRTFLAHVLTMVVTLLLATVLLSDSLRLWHRRERLSLAPVESRPGVQANASAPGPLETKPPAAVEDYTLPKVAPPSIDTTALKQSDADEQINVAVY